MNKKIENKKFDLERSLYNLKSTEVTNCIFEGPNDGESVLKETRNCIINKCHFALRYPLWHAKGFTCNDSLFTLTSRAPIWYAKKGFINNCTINGIKTIRECDDITINECVIDSAEFGWLSNNIKVINSTINSEYMFFHTNNVEINHSKITGKYTFQYINHLKINNSYLDTKDAFWHTKDAIIKDSVVKGEYLGWFSDGLTLINCKILGTQPLCYCKNLTLIDCTMEDCDLAFEYSDVNATIIGYIPSIKNPHKGKVFVDKVGEVIKDHTAIKCQGEVIIKK